LPDTLLLAMKVLGAPAAPGAGYFGGARGEAASSEAARDLREYEASLSAKAKDRVIRGIAKALKRAGLSIDADGDLDEVVKSLVAAVPRPGGKTFKATTEAHQKVCQYVAQALNDEFTPGATKPEDKFIDTSLSTAEICRQVGEWAHSFAQGVNTEFLAVLASARTALKNLGTLDEVLAELHQKITEKAGADGDSKLARELGPLDEVYRRAQAERKRQEELLKNLLHVQLPPDAKALEIAMREESDQYALVTRLGIVPGTGDFSDTLAAAVSGLGTAASIAQRVHKALAKVGLSVRQFLDAGDPAELRRLLDARLESGAKGDLAAFLQAAETVRAGFGSAREPRFREALEEAGKTGGADDRPSFGKKLEKRQAEKQVIVRNFAQRLAGLYDEMLAAIRAIGPELGKGIPLSDKSERLNDAVRRLRGHRDTSKRIELALIGIYSDADAREHKEKFIGALRQVAAACADLAGEAKKPEALARLGAACGSVEKTVDFFSDSVRQKFGGAETEATGGDESDLLAGAARNDLSLSEAVGEFVYAYYIARVRGNMAQTAKELETLGEDYTDLLGGAVAARLDALAGEKQAALALIAARAADPVFVAAGSGPAALAAAKKMVTDEFAAKTRFYGALQAIDLYLKAFTAGIAGDPDAVRDIKRILDGTQVIARWFSERTGDNLWAAFENMNFINYSAAGGPVPGAAAESGSSTVLAEFDRPTHYYEKVQGWLADSTHPPSFGVPTSGVPCATGDAKTDRAAAAQKHVDTLFDDFQALKNIVNAFARVGSRFGGEDLQSKVFMSPAQIYKALLDYLKCSALSLNRVPAGGGAPVALATPASDVGALPAVVGTVPAWGVYFGSVRGAAGNFAIEDRLFVRAIKAMAAKVLTAVGVYDMLERAGPLYDLTPTRMIVGGGEAAPEVLEEAAEMYFRLPRLVEYYYQLFRWDGSGADTQRIALMPDIDGTFSGLVRVIFLKATEPEVGDYSETEVAEIIREVNAIHDHFARSGKERATQTAVAALIADINRRYGVIKRQEAVDYWRIVRSARTGTYAPETSTNFSILPGEDEADYERRAPSDRFRAAPAGATSAAARDELDTDGTGALQLLRKFRQRIDKEFADADHNLFGRATYSDLIRQAELELKKTTDKAARIAIATRLIVGSGAGGSGPDKSLMFNESVVVGLNILGALTELLNQFDRASASMDPVVIEGAIMDAIQRVADAGGGAGIANMAALHTEIVRDPNRPALAHPTERSIFARYVAGVGGLNLAGRGGVAADVRIQDVFQLVAQVIAAIRAHGAAGGPNQALPRLSTVTVVNPSSSSDGLGTAAAGVLREQRARIVTAARLAARLLVRYDLIMRDFAEMLFDIGGDPTSLAEINIDSSLPSGIRLNFSRMRSTIEAILGGVKKYLDLLRPHLPKEVIDRFEKSSSGGSVFWIEKNLIDARLRSDDDKAQTLEKLSRRVGQIYANLTRDTAVGLNRVTRASLGADPSIAGNLGDLPASGEPSRVEQFGRAFSALLFYDAVDQTYNGADTPQQVAGAADTSLLRGFVLSDAWAPLTTAAGVAVNRHAIYAGDGGLTRFRSVMMGLNQLVAHFYGTFVAPGDRKIYSNLVTPFASGVASSAVQRPFGPYSFPDLATAVSANFGQRGDPLPSALLCSSLAAALRTLTTRPTGGMNPAPLHLVSQLIDVPLFMKETMRANLPGYAKLFRTVARKADFLRQLMDRTGVQLSRPSQVGATGAAADTVIKVGPNGADDLQRGNGEYLAESLQALKAFDAGQDHTAMRTYLVQVAASAGEMAQSLASISEDVWRELGDRPVFCQTGENSIEQFRIMTGKAPFMPHSLLLWFLNMTESPEIAAPVSHPRTEVHFAPPWADIRCVPRHTYGTADFKIAYGARGIVGGSTSFSMEGAPFTKALLEQYNAASSPREQFDAKGFGEFMERVVGMLRYLVDVQQFRAMLASVFPVFGGRALVGGAGQGVQLYVAPAPGRAAEGTASYALGPTVSAQDVIALVEESDPELAKRKIVDRFAGGAQARSAQGRTAERINNLVDMNVIPVNVHALMRGIPLANVFNYEFTFEQMAAAMFGENATAGEVPDAKIRGARQMFLALTCDPFREVPLRLYGSDTLQLGTAGFVHRIFRGDNNLGMGRPKFISDQLFNKALFGSVYIEAKDFDEGGPLTGVGIARGRDAMNPSFVAFRHVKLIMQQMHGMYATYRTFQVAGNPNGLVAAVAAVVAGPGAANQIAALRATARNWYIGSFAPTLHGWRNELRHLRPNPSTAEWDALYAILEGAGGAPADLRALEATVNAATGPPPAPPTAALDAALDALMNVFRGTGMAAGNHVGRAMQAVVNSYDQTGAGLLAASRMVDRPAMGNNINKLTFIRANGPDGKIVEVKVTGRKHTLEAIGKYRFDTRIVRKLFSIVNVLRIIRMKLHRELTQSRRVLVSSHAAVAPSATEFGADPFGPSEVSGSTLPGDLPRYADQDTD
jgi:hypothetical protein